MSKNRQSNWKRMIFLVICSLMIGIRLYFWNAGTLMRDAMPMPFGYGISVILSGSMEPELSVNDLVVVKKSQSYSVGDVVVYQEGGTLIIHRIIFRDGEEIITQGDANNTADAPIKISSIKGKKIGYLPYVGGVVRFLQSSVGFVLVLLVAIVLYELPYYKERKKVAEEQEKIKEEIRRLKDEE